MNTYLVQVPFDKLAQVPHAPQQVCVVTLDQLGEHVVIRLAFYREISTVLKQKTHCIEVLKTCCEVGRCQSVFVLECQVCFPLSRRQS